MTVTLLPTRESGSVHHGSVQVEGADTHYVESGRGPAVVLLHGDGESLCDWSWVLPALASRYRVVAPDLPGHGDSGKPATLLSPEFYTRWLGAFLDQLGLDNVVLVGNSLGGLIAGMAALGRPERVAALALLDSAGLGKEVNPLLTLETVPGVAEAMVPLVSTPLGAYQRAWARAGLFFSRPGRAPQTWIDEQVRLAFVPGTMEATAESLRADVGPWGQRVVLRDRLPQLTMPVLILWGERDRVLPLREGRQAAQQLPRGEFVVVPDAGHLPHVEQPDTVLGALLPFLQRVLPADGSAAQRPPANPS